MENITDADYPHGKKGGKGFEMTNLGEYHDLHVQRDRLLLADAFNNFQNICLEIHGFDPANFLFPSGLA